MMFGFQERPTLRSIWLGLSILAVTTGLTALQARTASLTPAPAPIVGGCLDLPPSEPRVVREVEPVAVRADRLYRAKRFAMAAVVVSDEAGSDVDLQNLAAQYNQLARSWTIAINPATPVTDAFFALREAWKLDTVLGGAFTDELYGRMASVAPRAAKAFARAHDVESAQLAADTAASLGR